MHTFCFKQIHSDVLSNKKRIDYLQWFNVFTAVWSSTHVTVCCIHWRFYSLGDVGMFVSTELVSNDRASNLHIYTCRKSEALSLTQ